MEKRHGSATEIEGEDVLAAAGCRLPATAANIDFLFKHMMSFPS
jgi:hypothetical protein